jgi:excisionase family DNA binding protein
MSTPEPFVDANKAAEFLGISRRHLLNLVRAGKLPAHKIGYRTWTFRLGELSLAVVRK